LQRTTNLELDELGFLGTSVTSLDLGLSSVGFLLLGGLGFLSESFDEGFAFSSGFLLKVRHLFYPTVFSNYTILKLNFN
jgi:hypothetical protein